MKHRLFLGALAAILIGSLARAQEPAQAAPTFSAEDIEFFEKRVRPVLAANCFECHSKLQQKAELRLDSREFVLRGSDAGAVVVLGKPDESRLIEAISYKNVDLQMPPRGRLPEPHIEALKQWIAMGLPWPEEEAPVIEKLGEKGAASEGFDLQSRKASHWAWQPIKRVAPPEVNNAEWNEHPIDRFIFSKLQEAELEPARQADPRTLIRRVYFDLIGLPPTPEAIEAFLSDAAGGLDESDGSEKFRKAFNKVVDELLASPQFGERWGRHWLDLVRYAESYGHEQDYPIRNAWQYRDYVIRALNADVPYDQFVMEHLAGDLLSEPRRHPTEGFNESIIGTGFWHFGQQTHGPVDVRQDEADRIDNQIDVFSKAFMGLTVACARCHDHKFDAISTKDYYAIYGFLKSSRKHDALLDPKGKIDETCSELWQVYEKGNDLFRVALEQTGEEAAGAIANAMEAAHAVMYGDWKESDGAEFLKPRIVFEDFEDGTYGRWKREGEAFNESPRERENGTFFAGSGTNDELEGALTSIPFTIERKFIHFRIGGKADSERLSVQLLIDDFPVRVASPNGRGLEWHYWDVSELAGQSAVLAIVDGDANRGAFVTVDDIVFSQESVAGPVSRPIAAVADEFKVDREHLRNWVVALQRFNPDDRLHPLAAWNELAAHREAADSTRLKSRLGRFASNVETAREEEKKAKESYEIFETFDGEDFGSWTATGWAFGNAPTKPGQAAPAAENIKLPPAGVVHSGLFSRKMQGVLRSETFTLTKKNIHYRAAGRGGKIRLVINGYQLREFNPLLFRGTLIEVNTGDRFTWINQTEDMSKFVGQKAYIEIIDDGEGYIAVDEIRFSDGDPAGEIASDVAERIAEKREGEAVQTIRDLAREYQALAAESIREWTTAEAPPAGAEFLHWLRENGLIDLGMADVVLASLGEHIAQVEADAPEPMRAVATVDGTGQNEYVFVRGSYKNEGEVAPRRMLEAICGADQAPIEEGSGRLELARRVLDPSNPLPARVMANRIWKHLMGEGIVQSVDNFGYLGRTPTHPELLDYLADRFRHGDTSIKRMIKFIVTSRAYQMSSAPIDQIAEERDPANELLHRARVKRLEGEVIRDSILAVSGRLNDEMYGPPIPIVITPFMDGRNRPESGPTDGEGRRSIYMTMLRNFLSPMMLTFDMPIPETTIGRRNVSNVPAQALVLMNDPLVVEQAKLWAKNVLAVEDATPKERIEAIYLRALGRTPTARETYHAMAFIKSQAESYGISEEECYTSEQVWTDFCHVVFNLKEFIFIG